MDTKKVSFGFKLAAKPSLLPIKCNKDAPKDFIKCLEDQKIKLVEEKQTEALLVIPMLTNQKTSTALESRLKRRTLFSGGDIKDTDNKNESNAIVLPNTIENCSTENLEKRAAYEILEQAKHLQGNNIGNDNLLLPIIKPDELSLNGAKESSINDYESVPVQQFGLAMLRGMGWVDPPAQQKKSAPVDESPFLRPKGMGLGADKAIKAKPLLVLPEANEVLEVKKNAYVRILGGKHRDLYGQIEGFDDHAGRVIVKMAIGGAKEAFNEFMCQPISKKEYAQYSKCINTVKFEKYKQLKNEHGDILVKPELKSKFSVFNEPSQIKTEDKLQRYDLKKRQNEQERQHYRDEQRCSKEFANEKLFIKSDDSKKYNDHDGSRNLKLEKSEVIRPESGYINTHSKCVQIESQDSPFHSKSKSTQHYSDEVKCHDLNKYLEERSRSKNSIDDKIDVAREPTQSDTDSNYEYRHRKKKSSRSTKHKKNKKKTRRADSSSGDEKLSHSSKEKTSRIKDKDRQNEKTKKSKHSRSHSRSRHRR